MRTDPPLRVLVVGLTILSVVACSSAVSRSPSPSATAPGTASTVPASGTDAPHLDGRTPLPGAAGEAWLVVGRRGEPGLQLTLSTTGDVAMAIPAGAPASSSSWERVLTATAVGNDTVVRDTMVQPGLGGPELRVPGHWQLPMVGLDPIPAGRSLDGSTAVLVEGSYDSSAARSRFAVVEHHVGDSLSTTGDADLRLARIVELPGAFEYDTLSPDGRILYVVQHLDGEAGGHYQVRAVDVTSGALRDGVIVDKAHPDESMAGSPIAQVRRPGGLVLTLYRGPEHPFIHALNSTDAWAVCIDLPAGRSADDAASLDWGLTDGTDAASVFAVNASLGLAVEVDPSELTVRRSASIATTAAAPIVLAKFGPGELGVVGRRLIPSPDGTLLFAAGRNGLTVIRTSDLTVVRTDLARSAIDALGVTPDGRTLFALLRDGGRIVGVDTGTGRRLVTVPGEGYDRLLAVAPG